MSYQVFYRFASAFAHAADMNTHVFLDNNGAFSVKLGPGAEHLPAIAAFARVGLWTTASRVNRGYRLARDAVLAAERPPELAESRARRRSTG